MTTRNLGLWVGAGAVMLSFVSPAAATKRTKVTIMNHAQEVPPPGNGTSSASGCGRFLIDTEANTLDYYMVFSGLTAPESAAHFHGPAAAGVFGANRHTLPSGSPKVGTWNYPENFEDDILNGRFYVNIHSPAFPGGEIRGQIVDMVAVLNGDQETPPTGSSGDGYGLFNLNTATNEMSYYIEVLALDGVENNAHIHGFALHGTSAGVVHTLPLGALKTGVYTYGEPEEDEILQGRTYVNIHSTIHSSGEIRGQITRLVVPGDGTQEVPPNAEGGHTCAFIAHDDNLDSLSYMVTHANLTGPATAAHIHGYAAPGANAGVVHNIGPATPTVGFWTYPVGRQADIFNGLTYINVHTAANPGGEVRGQIIFPEAPCPADIDCDGVVAFSDILEILGTWGEEAGAQDVDGNGIVSFGDILAVLAAWGPCP